MFDHCWSCEKASLSVRILKRDVSFKISDVKICRGKLRVSEGVTRIWKERGEKLMTCHLFLDNFWDFYDLWVVFKGFKSFETDFVSRKLKYLNLDFMRCSSFLNLVFRKRRFCYRKLIVFSCLQFADCYIWPRILSCGVIFVFSITITESFLWKVFLGKSWCCRKHVFVFEIVSLTDLNKFLIKLSFSLWPLGKRFRSSLWKKYGDFSILGVGFLLF